MGFGAYHPYPRRFGGGRPRLRIIHDALNASRGSAIDAQSSTTVAWVENMSHARALCFDGYGTNDRLALQWDPDRMTDMLPRWETIMKIRPAPNATEYDRRRMVRAKFRRFINASAFHSRVHAVLTTEIGEYFGAIEYIDIADAVIHVPDTSYPWGTMASGAPWSSNVAKVLVLLIKPEGGSEADFYSVAAKVNTVLDGVLPAWMTFDWYRAPASGAAVSVANGPSQAGFYLDNEHNLDNCVFDA